MKKLGVFGTIIGVIFVLAVVGWPIYTETVVSGTEKVGSLFGKVQPVPLTEGLHFVNPMVSYPSSDIFNLKPEAYTLNDLPMPAQDKLVTTMDVSFNVQFLPGKSAITRTKVGNPAAFKLSYLDNKVQGILISVGKSEAKLSSDYYGETALDTIKAAGMVNINHMMEGMAIVTNMEFSDIKLPTVIKDAVEATKKREQKVQEQQQSLEIKKLEAAELTAEAEAGDNAATFNKNAKEKNANAEAYRITTEAAARANARAYTISTEAKAKATANKQIAESITPWLIKYMNTQAKLKWDGQQPNTLIVGKVPEMLMQMN